MVSESLIPFVLIPHLLSFTSISASSEEDLNFKHNNLLPRVVHIINALPLKSDPANIACKSPNAIVGERDMNVGDEFTWNSEERSLYYCRAFWGRFLASWHALQPKRDQGKEAVLWLVKEDEFYLSWDGSTWVKKSVWQTNDLFGI